MTSKLICPLAVYIMTSLSSQAQDRRTLQISETDTVYLNATSIEYIVAENPAANFSAMTRDQKEMSGSEPPTASMATVTTMLRNHHIEWAKTSAKGYSIGSSIGRAVFMGGDSAVSITVHSEAELKSVYTLLAPLSGIKANVGQVEYGPMPDRLSTYKTLYQRALAEATGMAAISGKALGELIAVEEPQDFLWSVHQMMEGVEPTFNFLSEMTGNQRAKLQKKVLIKMMFKFELK